MVQYLKTGVGNLRHALSFDMACIRSFVTNLEYKIRSKQSSMQADT